MRENPDISPEERVAVALDKYSCSTPPDYVGFASWAEEIASLLGYSTMGERFRVAFIYELKRLDLQLKKNDVSGNALAKFKLLYSLLSRSHSEEFVDFILNGVTLADANALDDRLPKMSGFALRQLFFDAIKRKVHGDAFKLLAALRVSPRADDMTPGEVDYLEALFTFESGEYKLAEAYAQKVGTNSIWHRKATFILADSFALQGKTTDGLNLLRELPVAFFGGAICEVLELDFISCSTEPKQTIEELAKSACLQNHAAPHERDEFFELYISRLIRLRLELKRLMEGFQEQSEAISQTGGRIRSIEELGSNQRFGQLSSALSFDVSHPGPQGIELAAQLVSLAWSVPNFELVTEVFFEFYLADNFVREYPKLESALKYLNPHSRLNLLRMAHQMHLQAGSPRANELLTQLEQLGGASGGTDVRCMPIFQRLSPMGKQAWKAAVCGLDAAIALNNPWADAGMHSLGFFRILELELNEALIRPLKTPGIDEQVAQATMEMGDAAKKWEIFLKKFKECYSGPGKGGLELGALAIFLSRIAKPSETKLHQLFRPRIASLFKPSIDATGTLLRLAQDVNDEKRERFRNPPAHTRYLPIETALACKKHVEDALQFLFSVIA